MQNPTTTTLGYALSVTRWLQAPLYFGLVTAQGVYVYTFFKELWTLILICVSGHATETYVMLAVLKLVDVVMIANLLITAIVGISSVHLLQMFVDVHHTSHHARAWEIPGVACMHARPHPNG
ncbi:YqhA family protein [Streptomyces sp. NPDC006265]|uniref:YqhA family protein n=1 Tax=Streptomyces sp. NPDC006265 TaxID=3156740 RepID=UPI0033B79FF4